MATQFYIRKNKARNSAALGQFIRGNSVACFTFLRGTRGLILPEIGRIWAHPNLNASWVVEIPMGSDSFSSKLCLFLSIATSSYIVEMPPIEGRKRVTNVSLIVENLVANLSSLKLVISYPIQTYSGKDIFLSV